MKRWHFFDGRLRAGGMRRRLLMFLALLVIVVALLPQIVANTPLLNMLLSAAAPNGALRITAREAALSWISAPSVLGLEVKDGDGNLLAAVEKINLDRTPLNLLINRRELGVIQISRPTLHVAVRPDGSNLEDVVQKLAAALSADEPAADDSATTQPIAVAVQLVEGTVHVEDIAGGRRWRIEAFNAEYDARGAADGIRRAAIAGQIVQVTQAPGAPALPAGRFAVSIQPMGGNREQFSLEADALSLSILDPWLRRFVIGSDLSGTLSGQATATWTPKAEDWPREVATNGLLAIDRLDFSAPALVGDRVRLSRVELPWRVTSQPSGLAIEDLQFRTEIGQVAVRGRLDTDFAAAKHDVEMRGIVDVARLAALLPRAMRLREGTAITSGAIEFAGQYRPVDGGESISGSIRTAQLAATNAGRSLRWDQPVNANFALRRTHGELHIDTLRCDSQFLQLDAAGNAQQFTASAEFDLTALAQQLGQFVDLSGVQLAGTGAAKLDWRQAAADQFAATASGDFVQLAVSLPDGAVWHEPQLAIRTEAAGLLDPITHRPTRVDSGKLLISGQGDELDARLLAAVSLGADSPTWPASVRGSGSIVRWLTRVRPWLPLDPWQIDGQTEVSATLRVASNALDAADVKLIVNNLSATSPDWNIREPRLELSGDGRWNGATGEVSAGALQLVTSTISLATRDVRFKPAEQGIAQLMGAAAFRTDLARLAVWRARANEPAQYRPQGEITGNVRFAQQADRIQGEVNAAGQNLALASRSTNTATASGGTPAPGAYETIWQEPKLTLRGLASYETTVDRLAFEQLQIQSNTLQAAVNGQVQNVTTAADVNVNGTLGYDLAQLTPLLRPYVGTGIQFTGREQARFALAGKMMQTTDVMAQPVGFSPQSPIRDPKSDIHWSRRIRAQLELPWTGASLYGLPVGPGRLSTQLGDGALQIEPLSLALAEGRLNASPHVRFDPEPAELTLPAGPLLTNVRVSPEVSEALLKFVAPVLAGATQSEGLFSLQLDNAARLPLAEPKRLDSTGRLTVHSVRVAPGSMVKEWVSLAQQVEAIAKRRDPASLAARPPVTLLSVRDQQVSFRVADGRVHHQNMEFQVGDVVMRSQGSVGLDETLALTLSVPIQDAWIAKEPLLAGLKGQSLQVPVSGTLTRPQLDQRAIASLSGQLLQNAAGQAIGGELNKALDKLLKPR